MNVSDNTAQSRFELQEQGYTAFASYRLNGDVLTIPYVESPPALRVQGTCWKASLLMPAATK